MRGALTGKVRHQGPRYQVDWQSGVPSLPAPPPILLGGLGPKMLELAGEIADGAVLWLCAPEYIRREALPAIRRGRERAGKPLAGFEIVASVPAAITVDRGAALALFTELTGTCAPFYRSLRDRGLRAGAIAYDRPRRGCRSSHPRSRGGRHRRCRLRRRPREAAHAAALRPIGFPAPALLPTLERRHHLR